MFLRNPWQGITNREIASRYLSDTSLSDTGSITIAVSIKGHCRIFTVTENTEIFIAKQEDFCVTIKRLVSERDLIYFIKVCFSLPQQHLRNEVIFDVLVIL